MGKKVRVKVPGTTANCGPGFDVLGIACTLYNELELELLKEKKLSIVVEGEGKEEIKSSEDNLVWCAIKRLLQQLNMDYQGANIKMINKLPLARGMGSSSAAIVAGLYAANAWLDFPLDKEGIFALATELEGHPDNVAPAIFGGLTVSLQSKLGLKYIALKPDIPLKMVVAIPEFQLSTKKARSVLPKEVPFQDAIYNIAHTAMLVAGFSQGNLEALEMVFQDKLVQPYRGELIPGMNEVFAAANDLGALGTTISGAGPTLIAYTLVKPQEIGEAMVNAFANHQIKARYLILDMDHNGVEVL